MKVREDGIVRGNLIAADPNLEGIGWEYSRLVIQCRCCGHRQTVDVTMSEWNAGARRESNVVDAKEKESCLTNNPYRQRQALEVQDA